MDVPLERLQEVNQFRKNAFRYFYRARIVVKDRILDTLALKLAPANVTAVEVEVAKDNEEMEGEFSD